MANNYQERKQARINRYKELAEKITQQLQKNTKKADV